MLSAVGFPPGTVYDITNVTQDVPGTVTVSSVAEAYSFPIVDGQTVTVSKVKGMFQLNGNRYLVANLDTVAQIFKLYTIDYKPVDTNTFSPYVSGGEINIISYEPPPGQPAGLMYNNQ